MPLRDCIFSSEKMYFLIILFIYGCAKSSLLHGLFSSCGLQASYCNSFSCCGAQALGRVRFYSRSSWALEHRLSSYNERA